MKHRFHANGVRLERLVAMLVGLVASNCGTGRPSTVGATQQPDSILEAESVAVVELSASQLQEIRIEPVGTYAFPVEREAVGSIGFDEDLALVQAQSTLLGAAAAFELNTRELARARALNSTSNGVSQRELEQATSDQETAAAALKAARDAVRALGKTDPEIDHMIAARTMEPTLTADPGPNSSPKWALANVSESDIPSYRVGQPVELTVTAYSGRRFAGTVSRTYATVDPDTHRGKVRVEIADPKNELRAGMLANFIIRIQAPVEGTAIPANGVVFEGDGTMMAWVTTDRRQFMQRRLKLGLQRDGHYQVLDGLRPGELVVTDGAVFLSNMLQAPVE